MRYYKVLHDFHAADSVELSVKKGDLVAAPEHVEQDGWLKVELASDSRRRGFVPATYVRECGAPPSTPTPAGGAAVRGAAESSFTGAAMAYGESLRTGAFGGRMASGGRSMLDSPASQTQPEQRSVTNTMLSDPNSVVEAFMKNEVYFRQLMRQRQEALAKLESGINEAVADVAACKDKNSILARKLRDLDQTIEKERKKWRERVEEEKLLVQRSVHSSARVNPGSTSTLQVATTTRSVSQIATTLRPSH
jgi:hypothetical protein